MSELVFVKLGGSLITDKGASLCARPEVIARCAKAIAWALNEGVQLLVGHGSGSFGHPVAARYGTRNGVHSPSEWQGFARVAHVARTLDLAVVEGLIAEGVPAFPLPASVLVTARGGEVFRYFWEPLERARSAGLVPIVYGDVAFDEERGGTIISTEQLFGFLAPVLRPGRIVLATDVDGVFEADPNRQPGARRYRCIRARDLAGLMERLGGARGTDVTGGMVDKVRRMCALVQELPGLQVQILSGQDPQTLAAAILGRAPDAGTTIAA